MQDEEKYIYSQPVLELVRVATEYCKYMEQCDEDTSADDFCRVMRGLLPMLYLKMSLLPPAPDEPGWVDHKVTEDDYNFVRSSVALVLGANDDFLDTFVEDFKYSEQPVLRTVSENLADIYQQLRELVEAYRGGYDDAIQAAFCENYEEFRLQWGQKLLGALRAIHDLSFHENE